MPSRINHVKIVTPEPAVVDAFLREVCDVPEGWPLSADASSIRPARRWVPAVTFRMARSTDGDR